MLYVFERLPAFSFAFAGLQNGGEREESRVQTQPPQMFNLDRLKTKESRLLRYQLLVNIFMFLRGLGSSGRICVRV